MGRHRTGRDASIGEEVAERLRVALLDTGDERPVYVRIAVSLAGEMASGRIPSGGRLPTQRRLAEVLGVNLTTVTRAMSFLKDRGLILAEAGRGTAVRGRALDHVAPSYDLERAAPAIDLSVLKLHSARYDAFARDALVEIARSGELADLRKYQPALGTAETREAASRWFEDWGVPASPDRIAVTAGGQHGLVLALSSVSRPGDVVLAPRRVYQGAKGAARLLGLGLLPVETDEHGILPASVEEQASRSRARALFVVPTADNPTGTMLPLDRRREIAAMARRLSLAIIEDDIFRPLDPEKVRSFASLHPEGTFHVSSLAKTVAPGCRCGFLTYPDAFRGAVASSIRGSIWMADQISVALVRRLIASGLHRDIVAELRLELTRRHGSAERLLGPALGRSKPWSGVNWVRLDGGLRSGQVVDALHAAGIGVSGSDIFDIGPPGSEGGLRLYKSSPSSLDEWEHALAVIARHVRVAGPAFEAA